MKRIEDCFSYSPENCGQYVIIARICFVGVADFFIVSFSLIKGLGVVSQLSKVERQEKTTILIH